MKAPPPSGKIPVFLNPSLMFQLTILLCQPITVSATMQSIKRSTSILCSVSSWPWLRLKTFQKIQRLEEDQSWFITFCLSIINISFINYMLPDLEMQKDGF